MQQRSKLIWVLLLSCCAVGVGITQEVPKQTAPPQEEVAPAPAAGDGSPVVVPPENPNQNQTPEPPERPDTPQPPQTVKDLVKDFQAARERYLQEQKELRRQFRQASEEQREAIREQLRENLAEWLELQRMRVQELREQIRETRDAVKDYDRVLDAAEEKRRRP